MAFWRGVVLTLAMAVLCAGASAQETGRRVALVIGNGAYAAQGALANPGPDARLVADALKRVGFAVTPVNDAGKQAMERALRDFSRQADGAEVALVYYAGHGMEANGVNWLLPVDAQLADERDLSFEAISLDTVLATVERARGLRMVVLDACRNNPFTRSMRRSATTRSAVTRGLADVEVTGTLVLYAARGGTVAQDGAPGGNSPFAAAFARRIPEPGVDIRLLVSKVRDDVLAATGRAQEPFSYGSLPGVEMVLALEALGHSPSIARSDNATIALPALRVLDSVSSADWTHANVPSDAIVRQSSLASLKAAAELGEPRAQFVLAGHIWMGHTTEAYAEATIWMRRSALQGFAPAQARLGYILLNRDPARRECAEGYRYLRLAAEQGNADGQAWLGSYMLRSECFPANPVEARKWIDAAIAQGSILARVILEGAPR